MLFKHYTVVTCAILFLNAPIMQASDERKRSDEQERKEPFKRRNPEKELRRHLEEPRPQEAQQYYDNEAKERNALVAGIIALGGIATAIYHYWPWSKKEEPKKDQQQNEQGGQNDNNAEPTDTGSQD